MPNVAEPLPYAVIMAGGSGTRFWPLSRSAQPKQLVSILTGATMIQATVARLQPLIAVERILIVTTVALAAATRAQLPLLGADQIIAEPVGRDTAAAVALAAMVVEHRSPGAAMVLLPADQVISPTDAFQHALAAGIAAAQAGALVTYGIPPRHAATGYGYIHVGTALPARNGCGCNTVARFVEKPDAATAQRYCSSVDYRWNSGIFTWRSDVVLRELARHCPWLIEGLAPLPAALGSAQFATVLAAAYAPLRRISIDYALMEKADGIQVITGDFMWDDVGAWDSLYDHSDADDAGVRQRGAVVAHDCHDSLMINENGPLIAAVGVRDLTIVSTPDAVLVVPRGRSQDVKALVDALKRNGLDAVL